MVPPEHWVEEIDERLSAPDVATRIRVLVACLPDGQRQVVTLRDVEGLSAADVCNVLGITEGNQRVLLHRGRSRVRAQLEREVERWERGDRAAQA